MAAAARPAARPRGPSGRASGCRGRATSGACFSSALQRLDAVLGVARTISSSGQSAASVSRSSSRSSGLVLGDDGRPRSSTVPCAGAAVGSCRHGRCSRLVASSPSARIASSSALAAQLAHADSLSHPERVRLRGVLQLESRASRRSQVGSIERASRRDLGERSASSARSASAARESRVSAAPRREHRVSRPKAKRITDNSGAPATSA